MTGFHAVEEALAACFAWPQNLLPGREYAPPRTDTNILRSVAQPT